MDKKFLEKILKKDDCWIWQGSLSDGYGYFKGALAHRYSYIQNKGPIPQGLVLDHLCRNRDCVNPGHLEIVTRAENIRRGETGRKPGGTRGSGKCGVDWCVQPRAKSEKISKRTGELLTLYSAWCQRHAQKKYRLESPRKINSIYSLE